MDNSQQNSNSPLVSVIIPAYNAEKFLKRTLESVLNQTYSNIEVLVVNDGSKDQTSAIVQLFAEKDKRIILLSQPNSGVAAARNLAIQKSQGEFIAPIDADDIWYPHNLEKQVKCFLENDSSIGIVYAWSVDIDENDDLTGEFRASEIEGEVYTTLILHDFIANASSVVIRKNCFERVGGYRSQLPHDDKQFKYSSPYLRCEDLELYLRIAEYYQFKVVPEFLIGYRKLPHSMSANYMQMAESRYLIWQSVKKKYPRIPNIMGRLSLSSLYMNLARQSSKYGHYQTTMELLSQAIKKDRVTPFLRLGLYSMFIKSYWHLKLDSLNSDDDARLMLKKLAHSPQKVITIEQLRRKNILANFKFWVEKLLHKFAPILFGTPQDW